MSINELTAIVLSNIPTCFERQIDGDSDSAEITLTHVNTNEQFTIVIKQDD